MKKDEQLIGEILLDQLPKNILGALRVMASLTYPISDRRSFIAQLENLVKHPQESTPSEQVEALRLVRGALTELDFPILTPASGLEKTFAYFSDPYEERDFAVVTREAQNNDTQRWIVRFSEGNSRTLQQKSSGRFLDAHEIGERDFALVTRPARDDDTQRWLILAA